LILLRFMATAAIVLFSENHLAWLRRPAADGPWQPTALATADDAAAAWEAASAELVSCHPEARPVFLADSSGPDGALRVGAAVVATLPAAGPHDRHLSFEAWAAAEERDPAFATALLGPVRVVLEEQALRLPYLYQHENEYIYRFRTERERNRAVYQPDSAAGSLYQSRLCEAIKALKRTRERLADSPATLDFGPVRYVLPSHFGFCLGVQNAIERAYETLAENPGRRVFMLSELIHNPFVNEDLVARGLRYLQSDKGEPARDPASGRPWWDLLNSRDIVIIPAFGASDADKRRLLRRGLALNRYDATCMLVEKVWKAARRFGEEGYTVLLHGKAEHEETKATFSNSARHAPTLMVRDLAETRLLCELIAEPDTGVQAARFAAAFAHRATPGFDPARDLDRIAVVNQTTLLRNETLRIIEQLESFFSSRHGKANLPHHLHPRSKGDTLCYATQVNQDALERALAEPVDVALVVGGRNSSNTYQLYRLCAQRFGDVAHYIQSEANLVDAATVMHYRFATPTDPRGGGLEARPLLPAKRPVTVLVTGGASCPDGIIQQVITRLNGFFPPEELRPLDTIVAELEAAADLATADHGQRRKPGSRDRKRT